jgi:hypothetical protein
MLLNNYKESILVAEHLCEEKTSFLWTIVCSYYAMFYIANIALSQAGYKIGEKIPHKVCADSIFVFLRDKIRNSLMEEYEDARKDALAIVGIKTDELLDSFDKERIKRSNIQYKTPPGEISAKAKTSLERAKRFIFEMEKIIEK